MVFLFLFSAVLVNAQANLPVSRTTWNSETPLGWTDWGTSADTTSSDKSLNLGKLENTGDYYEIFFNTTPKQLIFQMKGESFQGGNFSLQESTDGVYWSNLKTYKSITDNCERQQLSLKSTSRYIRFLYTTKRNGNIYIDEVEITSAFNVSS